MSPAPKTISSTNASVYYQGQYWNDLHFVRQYLNQKISGQPQTEWVDMLAQRYAHQPFQRGLFINCGNGWVERQFIDKGIVKSAEGFDFSEELIQQAEKEKGDRQIFYRQADANKITFKKNSYDLIVNSAALHHVQYLDRLCRELYQAITPDGVFFHYEYVGPSRNQYPPHQWQLIKRWNTVLPPHLQHPQLLFPHVPTMLREDPSEAIHSDLIIPTVSRYFWIKRQVELGGGLAYPLLTHNQRVFQLHEGEWEDWLRLLIDVDQKLTQQGKIPNLFWYAETVPKPSLPTHLDLDYWLDEEQDREKQSQRWLNAYSFPQYINVRFDQAKRLVKTVLKRLLFRHRRAGEIR